MDIGIIGAGNIGGNLTRRFQELGHKVFVANSRGPETLSPILLRSGATPVSVHEAAQRGEVVKARRRTDNRPQWYPGDPYLD